MKIQFAMFACALFAFAQPVLAQSEASSQAATFADTQASTQAATQASSQAASQAGTQASSEQELPGIVYDVLIPIAPAMTPNIVPLPAGTPVMIPSGRTYGFARVFPRTRSSVNAQSTVRTYHWGTTRHRH